MRSHQTVPCKSELIALVAFSASDQGIFEFLPSLPYVGGMGIASFPGQAAKRACCFHPSELVAQEAESYRAGMI